jgi:hypothetical protein
MFCLLFEDDQILIHNKQHRLQGSLFRLNHIREFHNFERSAKGQNRKKNNYKHIVKNVAHFKYLGCEISSDTMMQMRNCGSIIQAI